MNPSADAKLDPTVGPCLPPSQLFLFPEVLRRPLEFTLHASIAVMDQALRFVLLSVADRLLECVECQVAS